MGKTGATGAAGATGLVLMLVLVVVSANIAGTWADPTLCAFMPPAGLLAGRRALRINTADALFGDGWRTIRGTRRASIDVRWDWPSSGASR